MKSTGKGIFYGWWIVVACFICLFIAYGSRYSFGVFFKPMSKELGWTRAMTASAFTFSTILYGLVSPMVGRFVDKVGVRIVMMIGAVLAGIGYGLIYFTNSLVMFYIFYSVIATIGIVSSSLVPSNTVVAKWFTKKRALAMGIITIGIGVGPFVLINVSGWMIQIFGWRFSFVLLGIAYTVIIVLVAWLLIKNSPQEKGLLPDGASEPAAPPAGGGGGAPKGGTSQEVRVWTLKSAMLTPVFWCISLCYFFFLLVYASVMVHGVAFATDIGHSAATATFAVSILLGTSMGGKVLGGWLGDRYALRYVLAGFILMEALVIAVFIGVTGVKTLFLLYLFMALFGFAYGAVTPLISAMTADAFGTVSFGVIYGGILMISLFGMGTGPTVAGFVYDQTGSYYMALMGYAFILIVSLVLSLLAKKPKQAIAPAFQYGK